MSDGPKWRVEKIHSLHAAYINNPHDFPTGHWYGTDDPQDECTKWIEFCAPTWEEAIKRIEEHQ